MPELVTEIAPETTKLLSCQDHSQQDDSIVVEAETKAAKEVNATSEEETITKCDQETKEVVETKLVDIDIVHDSSEPKEEKLESLKDIKSTKGSPAICPVTLTNDLRSFQCKSDVFKNESLAFDVRIENPTVICHQRCYIITLHDLGHDRNQFNEFVNCNQMNEIRNRVVWLHVNLPGQGSQDEALNKDLNNTTTNGINLKYPTMEELADALISVPDYLNVPQVVCMGIGAGANLAALFAIKHAKRCLGTVLVEPIGSPANLFQSIRFKLSGFNSVMPTNATPDTPQESKKKNSIVKMMKGAMGSSGSETDKSELLDVPMSDMSVSETTPESESESDKKKIDEEESKAEETTEKKEDDAEKTLLEDETIEGKEEKSEEKTGYKAEKVEEKKVEESKTSLASSKTSSKKDKVVMPLRNANGILFKNLEAFATSFVQRSSLIDKLQNFKVDALIACGKQSAHYGEAKKFYSALQSAHKNSMGQLVNTPFVEIDNCGVNLFSECPDKLATSLQYFLQGIGLLSALPMRNVGLRHGSVSSSSGGSNSGRSMSIDMSGGNPSQKSASSQHSLSNIMD